MFQISDNIIKRIVLYCIILFFTSIDGCEPANCPEGSFQGKDCHCYCRSNDAEVPAIVCGSCMSYFMIKSIPPTASIINNKWTPRYKLALNLFYEFVISVYSN